MRSSEILNGGTRLTASLLEFKNPIVIFCGGTLTGATFYFRNIDKIYLLTLCLVICIPFFFIKNWKILVLAAAVVFGYFYSDGYLKVSTVNLDNLLNKRNIYIGEISSLTDDSGSFYKKYFLKGYYVINKSNFYEIKKNIRCKVQILGSRYEEYEVGDIVQVTGILKKSKEALLPGLFDESKYLLTKNVHYILKADPGTLVFLDAPNKTLIKRKINELRNKLISANEKYLPKNNLAIVNGILVGSKASSLPHDLKDKIQVLGLSHITAASGFNVSVLTAGVFYLFSLFYRGRFLPAVISIFVVLLYSALADFSSSILRATTFIILVLAGNLFDKKIKILPGISLIVLLFFFFAPVNILDPGLQLSILAFLGLVLFVDEAKNNLLPFINKKTNWLFLLFLESLFAQIMVLPLIVFYFHNVQLFGLISNLVAVPLASLILIIGVISLLITFIPGFDCFSEITCFLLKVFSDLFLSWINFLSKAVLKQIFLPNFNFYFLILIYIFILFSLCAFFIIAVRKKFIHFSVFLILFSLLVYALTDTSRHLKIFCFPHYNNEAILVVIPHNKPVFLGTRLNESNLRNLQNYLRLNNISTDFTFFDLGKNQNNFLPSPFFTIQKNKIIIKYKDFSFEIIKNYHEKITNEANCVKLPVLMKSDPPLEKTFLSYPKCLIVNDYKRLSKKSVNNINWLKSKLIKSFFLSESGTITLVTDGKKFTILPEI